MSGLAECPFVYYKENFVFTLVCCVLCESVLALEFSKSWGVAGVKTPLGRELELELIQTQTAQKLGGGEDAIYDSRRARPGGPTQKRSRGPW
jgi:hypothetical protein